MNMKKYLVFILALSVALVGSINILTAQEPMPPTEGAAFWKYITETNPYTTWKMWPGKEGMYPGKSPHGAALTLYVNDKAYEAIQQNKKMPSGAIIVKENYAEDKEKLLAVTPMYKVEGYNPGAGNWFWAKNGPDGKTMASGKVDSCIKCHNAVKGNDYLFTKPR